MLCCCLFTCLTAAQGCVTLMQRWDAPGGLLVWEGNTTPSHGICILQQCLRTKGGLDGSHKHCISLQIRLKLENRNDWKIEKITCRNRKQDKPTTSC